MFRSHQVHVTSVQQPQETSRLFRETQVAWSRGPCSRSAICVTAGAPERDCQARGKTLGALPSVSDQKCRLRTPTPGPGSGRVLGHREEEEAALSPGPGIADTAFGPIASSSLAGERAPGEGSSPFGWAASGFAVLHPGWVLRYPQTSCSSWANLVGRKRAQAVLCLLIFFPIFYVKPRQIGFANN